MKRNSDRWENRSKSTGSTLGTARAQGQQIEHQELMLNFAYRVLG